VTSSDPQMIDAVCTACDERLLESVLRSLNLLLAADDIHSAVTLVLAILCRAVEVERAYVFEAHPHPETGELLVSQRYEWCPEDAEPQIDNPALQNHPIEREFPRWFAALSAGRSVSGPVAGFPEQERLVLEPQDIVSLMVVPIMIDGCLWGFIGFDDCCRVRSWTRGEELGLKAAAIGLGSAIIRHRADEALLAAQKELGRKLEELHEREQEFRALVENAQDVIVRVDEKLRIVYVNPALQTSTGFPRRWFLGRPVAAMGLPPRRSKQIDRVLKTVFATGREKVQEVEFQDSDGKRRYIQFRLTPEFSRTGGKVTAVLGVGRDITAQKSLETRLRAANRAKNEFMANMSHELRTPLSGILGLVKLALDRPQSVEMRHDLEMIETSARSLLHLINGILDLSRIEAGKLELDCTSFVLREMLEAVMEPFSVEACARGVGCRLLVQPDVPAVIRADPFRLGQILKNLVSNGLKFTEEGEVCVEVTCLPGSSGNTVRLAFSVVDTGIGISPTDQRRLFRTFSQLDASLSKRFEGAGLGLAISRQLARKMGGELEISSQKGKGSRFTLVAEFEMGTLQEQPDADKGRGRPVSPLRILLAEDNPVNKTYILRFLQGEGHRVTAVVNGIEALEALGREAFDLVLMDVQMPQMDGMEATKRIRCSSSEVTDPSIPIIALTAYAMTSDSERFLGVGMNDCVTKPIDFDRLSAVLQKWGRSGVTRT
jgi:PAS domain S-box-containing protein